MDQGRWVPATEEAVSAIVMIRDVLTAQECTSLRAEMDAAPLAPVAGGPSMRFMVDTSHREWVRNRLLSYVPVLEETFGPIVEMDDSSPRFHVYRLGDSIKPHVDRCHEKPRVSVALSLLVASDADGEDSLRIYGHAHGQADGYDGYLPIPFVPGLLIAFPGDAMHGVAPVTANRYAVVAWLLEP